MDPKPTPNPLHPGTVVLLGFLLSHYPKVSGSVRGSRRRTKWKASPTARARVRAVDVLPTSYREDPTVSVGAIWNVGGRLVVTVRYEKLIYVFQGGVGLVGRTRPSRDSTFKGEKVVKSVVDLIRNIKG